jgi:Predicted AAA-ATPase/PD-(D/E)XK nuclease superfamily
MLKIPYGQSNFASVIKNGYFYQDRSNYIRELEEKSPKFIYYLRPRRFGKSLFVSMLHYYYGLEHQSEFQNMFGKLNIGKKPTPLANQYMVLSFEFSSIQTNTAENTLGGFLSNVRAGVSNFLYQYSAFFLIEAHEAILNEEQPNELLKNLFNLYAQIRITSADLPKIYLIIDEYDHFANELISFNFDLFSKSVTENGFVRKFYEAIKTATRDGIVDRLFITGVSPITLDSMTSGFNIGTNLSLRPSFHSMMGFEEAEVRNILRGIGIKKANLEATLSDLRAWYDGYLFHLDAKCHVYNPDMVLYFAEYVVAEKQYPDELLDPNIASDYSKIRNVFKIQNREVENIAVLNTLTETGAVTARLTIQFSLEKIFHKDDLISLLFYMGFLTIAAKEVGGFIFRFPNYVIERLYSDYFIFMLQSQKNLPIDNSDLNAALREIGKFGNPKLLYVEVMKIVKTLSTRDSQGFNENSLKAIFVSILQQQQFYYVHSEYESERQYIDVFLETIRGQTVKFEVAFELKYVKKAEKIDVEQVLDKAETQLLNYMVSKKFIERPSLKAFVVLVHGTELYEREIILSMNA